MLGDAIEQEDIAAYMGSHRILTKWKKVRKILLNITLLYGGNRREFVVYD